MKNTNSTNILVRLLTVNMKTFLTPKNPKMCDPNLETVLKMRPHYSQSSRENATSFSGTSPLAFYKEEPPPLLKGGTCGLIVKIFRVAEKENAEVIWNTWTLSLSRETKR